MKKFIIVFFLPLYIFSQSSLSGTVKDKEGYPIMGANIIAVNNETDILDDLEYQMKMDIIILT